MKLSTSVKAALVILAALIVYFGVRTLTSSPGKEAVADAAPLFAVVAQNVEPEAFRDQVVVRGRTQALKKITLRTETAGVVSATPADPGTLVRAGAPLCKLRLDARSAGLAEARAANDKAKLDYDAAMTLAEEGYQSKTAVAGARASLDLAKANLEQAELAVSKTTIAAPWDGVFDERLAEAGDFLSVGDPCGVLIQQTPFLVVGAVSEKDVAKIKRNDRGEARLTTGETVEGRVRLVSKAADPATRTFSVELEIPNPDGGLRDGVTAEFTIFADRLEAHAIPRSALTLDDEGRIGVRLVDAENRVAFAPVNLIGERADAVWVSGLNGAVRLITRGQEFVTQGQKVEVAGVEAQG